MNDTSSQDFSARTQGFEARTVPAGDVSARTARQGQSALVGSGAPTRVLRLTRADGGQVIEVRRPRLR